MQALHYTLLFALDHKGSRGVPAASVSNAVDRLDTVTYYY